MLRNPVTGAGDMRTVTDIPDWCYAEFGFPTDGGFSRLHARSGSSTRVPMVQPAFESPNDRLARYNELQSRSPIHVVQDVDIPVLLLVGEQDQRVPASQSREYFYELTKRGKSCKMLSFPNGGHSLEQVDYQRMTFEATRDWFRPV